MNFKKMGGGKNTLIKHYFKLSLGTKKKYFDACLNLLLGGKRNIYSKKKINSSKM